MENVLRFLAHPAVGKLSYYACLQDLMCQIVAVFLIDDVVVADPATNTDIPPDQRGLGVVFQDYADLAAY